MQKIKDLVFDRLQAKTDEMERLLSENEVLVSRLKGVKVVDAEDRDQVLGDRSRPACRGRAI
jgi:NADH:ubiquinone oxidoreductase subunit D